ncbi:transposase family protein [Vibrio cholerae]|nr:transposase family protein [Vibrio cholerae]
MLNIENLKVIEREEYDDHCIFHAQSISPNRTCSECGSINTVIVGKANQPYSDTRMYGKTIKIQFERRRLRCKDCNKTCFEQLDWLSSDFRMTRRAEDYIMRMCGKVPFTHVATEMGITPFCRWRGSFTLSRSSPWMSTVTAVTSSGFGNTVKVKVSP